MLRPWQTDGKGRALAEFAFHAGAAFHDLGEILDDGKAQSRSAEFARTGFVHAIEALENPRHILFRNAGPVILDLDANLLALAIPANANAAAVLRVLQGVIDQVVEDLRQ